MKMLAKEIARYHLSLYTFIIYEDKNTRYLHIHIDPTIKDMLNKVYVLLSATIPKKIPTDLYEFDSVVQLIKQIYQNMLNEILYSQPEILKDFKQKKEDIITYLAYKTLGLEKIFPFLIDENINEIYLDNPNSPIYVDHKKFGRLNTLIYLSHKDIEKIVYLGKLESNTLISYENPSLKTEIKTDDFAIRLAIDFPPLIANGVSFTIRKIQQQTITPSLFIKTESDAFNMALILIALALRSNIVVVGEPGSGKTTLSSILINFFPQYWRIIAIEDVRELNVPARSNKKIVRIKVNPIEASLRYSKEQEIIKLLHRSPDYFIIGELQNKNDNLAFFHALSAGLKGLATIHASNVFELLDRWLKVFNIDESRLARIDLIVFMRKKIAHSFILRKIDQIFLIPPNFTLDDDLNELKGFLLLVKDLILVSVNKMLKETDIRKTLKYLIHLILLKKNPFLKYGETCKRLKENISNHGFEILKILMDQLVLKKDVSTRKFNDSRLCDTITDILQKIDMLVL